MKKLLLIVIVLAVTINMAAQDDKSNSDVNNEWRNKPVVVKNGGATPNVVTLLRAFHQAMPTWVVGEVLKQNDKPGKGTRKSGSAMIWEDDSEGDYRILIDTKNGYADLSSMTDIDQMSCCVWRKTNGHRIFAVSLYEQHDPVQHLLCWYDYDPQTQTMTAAKSPMDHYKKPFGRMDIGWSLPMQGTDFIIREYCPFPDASLTQIYKWDGMEHRYSKTQISDFSFQCFGEGDWLKASEQGFKKYALVDLDNSGSPCLCLCKSEEEPANFVVLNGFKGKMQTVTVCDEADMLESIHHVVPETGKPWTSKDVVAYTSDFEHTHYYVVLQDGLIGYIVTSEPEGEPTKNGYGSKDESIDIIRAERGKIVSLDPQWKPFEFIEEEP